MPIIVSIGEAVPENVLEQQHAMEFAKEIFSNSFRDIERLLQVFQNGQIEKRHIVQPIEWYKEEHSFGDKNKVYIEAATNLGVKAIKNCLANEEFLTEELDINEIEAIFMISSTGLATPSIEARIMNQLTFSPHTKRIPIWGLGCAGGAGGLSRAYEYCLAYPNARVLVVAIELCSLTFQRKDLSKSNFIGTSLFADGVACALLCGDKVDLTSICKKRAVPTILATQSTLMPQSLDVMGWEVRSEGLHVIFSKDIPTIVENWLKPNVLEFLSGLGVKMDDITHFIAHPGGKKVLEAYQKALHIPQSMTEISLDVLKNYGNMSSVTIFFVLRRYMERAEKKDVALVTALGPGFSSELLWVRWESL
jgi:alkylresorcinol/alkylpyrone synthase